MLFTFPSQYWFAIGLSGVFSLTGWAPQFHARFLVPRATQDATRLQSSVVYGTITLYGRPFQGVPLDSILPRRGKKVGEQNVLESTAIEHDSCVCEAKRSLVVS